MCTVELLALSLGLVTLICVWTRNEHQGRTNFFSWSNSVSVFTWLAFLTTHASLFHWAVHYGVLPDGLVVSPVGFHTRRQNRVPVRD